MKALSILLDLTEERVDWLPEAFDDLVVRLGHSNSFQRSIAVMLLANLAKSDDAGRVGKILPRILALTMDEKFITRRQCIQSLWRFAVASDECGGRIVEHLRECFSSCASEKHFNLIRQDILVCLARIAAGEAGGEKGETGKGDSAPHGSGQLVDGGKLFQVIDALIESEADEKYRRSYLKALRESGCVIEEM
jgi:hypothetical protein